MSSHLPIRRRATSAAEFLNAEADPDAVAPPPPPASAVGPVAAPVVAAVGLVEPKVAAPVGVKTVRLSIDIDPDAMIRIKCDAAQHRMTVRDFMVSKLRELGYVR